MSPVISLVCVTCIACKIRHLLPAHLSLLLHLSHLFRLSHLSVTDLPIFLLPNLNTSITNFYHFLRFEFFQIVSFQIRPFQKSPDLFSHCCLFKNQNVISLFAIFKSSFSYSQLTHVTPLFFLYAITWPLPPGAEL